MMSFRADAFIAVFAGHIVGKHPAYRFPGSMLRIGQGINVDHPGSYRSGDMGRSRIIGNNEVRRRYQSAEHLDVEPSGQGMRRHPHPGLDMTDQIQFGFRSGKNDVRPEILYDRVRDNGKIFRRISPG